MAVLEIAGETENFLAPKSQTLCDGDRNTRFFHKYATARKEVNKIRGPRNDAGEWIEEEEQVQELIIEYFDKLYTASNVEETMSDRVCFKQINEEQKQTIMLPVRDEEVKVAILAMHSDKAPGIDGLNPAFFKTYWDIVGRDVVQILSRIL